MCWIALLLQEAFSIPAAVLNGLGLMAVVGALGGLYYMYKCYRIPARPFWNHWQTATSFVGNALSLGALISGGFVTAAALTGGAVSLLESLQLFGSIMAAGIALEVLGLIYHAKNNAGAEHEGAASHYIQTTTFGKTYIARNIVMGVLLVSVIALLFISSVSVSASSLLLTAWAVVALMLVMSVLVSRALFYVLVVPTTMPGAFFWRNKGFEQHAKDIGLANVVDAGIVADSH